MLEYYRVWFPNARITPPLNDFRESYLDHDTIPPRGGLGLWIR